MELRAGASEQASLSRCHGDVGGCGDGTSLAQSLSRLDCPLFGAKLDARRAALGTALRARYGLREVIVSSEAASCHAPHHSHGGSNDGYS